MSAVLAEFGFDGLHIEFKPVERKITSRHGVDSRPLSERQRHEALNAVFLRLGYDPEMLLAQFNKTMGTEGNQVAKAIADIRSLARAHTEAAIVPWLVTAFVAHDSRFPVGSRGGTCRCEPPALTKGKTIGRPKSPKGH